MSDGLALALAIIVPMLSGAIILVLATINGLRDGLARAGHNLQEAGITITAQAERVAELEREAFR